jgi:AcrR family transcriptional regulator
MPSLLHTPSRTDTIVAGVSRLIASGGLAAVTTRAIATETGISTASLAHHLTNRERLMSVVGYRTGRAHLADALMRRRREGSLAFLPLTDEQIVATRVWLAWCELARSEPGVAIGVADIEADERALLNCGFDEPLGEDDLETAMALVRGLRAAVCAGKDPMPVGRARELLTAWLASRVPAPETMREAPGYPADAASARARSSATIRSGSSAE